ncbi:MAG: universal stress protein [Chloroflexota bacterium]
MTTSSLNLAAAIKDFQQARRQAAIQQIIARLTGGSADLFSFEDVRHKLKLQGISARGLREIPLEAIVGSVGRYRDFTRNFLPRRDADQARWASVAAAMNDLAGLPPIEVYQIGEAYFVLDGNHRVSVARRLGAMHIDAYVTEFKTKVPLLPSDQLDDLIIKAEYADFLEKTKLDELRPHANLRATAPGRYWELETQIEAQQFLLGQAQGRAIPYGEAVSHWYDHVYLPVIQLIRERGILQDFPNRTETDLYLWILRYRSELQKELGWQIAPSAAAVDLIAAHSPKPTQLMARVEGKLWDALTPDTLEAGPPPGQWREKWLVARPDDRLFVNILVALSGRADGWYAVDQALTIAQREGGRLYGLHIVAAEAEKDGEPVQALASEFSRRCATAGVEAEFSVETGPVARKICDRARWVDLVVMRLAYPPGAAPLERLGSGARTIIQRCPRPLLMVPHTASPLTRVLLAYDGSPKAREGLFVATYLAGQWPVELTVMTVLENGPAPGGLAEARQYLEAHGVSAAFEEGRGKIAETILQTAARHQTDLIIMGGYGSNPAIELVLGSSVDQVLRESAQPVLICR